MTTIPTLLADILVSAGALLAWFFVIVYRRYDWRATDEGRHIMAFTLMIGVILTFVMTVRIFGPLPLQQWIACALYGWMVYLLAARSRLMLRANRKTKKDDEEAADVDSHR